MNIFKRIISGRKSELEGGARNMLSFSKKIEREIGVSAEVAREAHDLAIDIPGFTLQPRCFCNAPHGWEDVWVALPVGQESSKAGYAGTEDNIPSSWHYIPLGTCTTICPPDCVQEKILSIIRDCRNGKAQAQRRDTGMQRTNVRKQAAKGIDNAN